jgi:hypothetical protein
MLNAERRVLNAEWVDARIEAINHNHNNNKNNNNNNNKNPAHFTTILDCLVQAWVSRSKVS